MLLPGLAWHLAKAEAQERRVEGGLVAGDGSSLDELIERSRRDPANVALVLEIARVASTLGEIETAIGALERLLIFDPGQPRLRLQLGALYQRLGALDLARLQFEQALAGSGEDLELAPRARTHLAAIGTARARNVVAGELLVGGRYQTNPKAAGSSSDVRIGDQPVRAGQEEKDDFSLFAQGVLTHTYRFDTQWDDVLASELRSYAELFATQTRQDFTFLELESGPRIGLGRLGLGDASLRPFATAAYATLDRAYYFHWLGVGLELHDRWGAELETRFRLRVRRQGYVGTQARPYSGRNGWREDALVGATWALGPRDAIDGLLYAEWAGARDDEQAYGEAGASLIYGHSFGAGAGAGVGPLTLYGGGSIAYSRYRGSDPDVEPGRRRKDFGYGLRGGAVLAVTPAVALQGEVEHRFVQSNVEVYQYGSTAALLALRLRF